MNSINHNERYLQQCENLLNLILIYYLKYNFCIVDEDDNSKSILKNLICGSNNTTFASVDDVKEKIIADYKKILVIKNDIRVNNIFVPILFLFDIFEFSLFEKFCFLLGYMYVYDERYKLIFSALNNSQCGYGVSVDIALNIFNGLNFEPVKLCYCFNELNFSILGLNHFVNKNKPLQFKTIIISNAWQSFVSGLGYTDDDLEEFTSVCSNVEETNILLLHSLNIYINNINNMPKNKLNIVCIKGAKGCGKKTQARIIAKKFSKPIIFVDFEIFTNKSINELREILLKITLKVYVDQSILCITNFNKNNHVNLKLILLFLYRFFIFIIILTDEKNLDLNNIDQNKILFTSFIIPDLDEKQRVDFWNMFIKNNEINKDDLEKLSRGFILTVGEIKSIAEKYYMVKTDDYIENLNNLKNLCVETCKYNFGEIAFRVKQSFTWDDIILDESCKCKLLNMVDRVKYKYKVYDSWGFKSKFPYGSGISALFYGPPGTGKTMAAQIMAKQIGCELYKIDLSQVVDKYVGETEKNLKKIFDNALKTNVILFFDEADAVFSKRTNVYNANDKYANVETAYLLQKIEEYEGVTILATNLLSGFDDAFKRRIKFIVNFTIPNVNNRFILWQKSFPEKVKISQDVDFFRLAEKYELTGSDIKAVAISAAFYAAAAKNEVISIKHIRMALKDEFEKNGKVFLKSDMDIY